MSLAAPQYRIGLSQPGGSNRYCLTGFYPGYSVGLGSTGSLHTTLTAIEGHLTNVTGNPWYYEAVVISAGNNMTIANLSSLTNCPQFIIYNFPMVPLNSGSISLGNGGSYDSLIDAFFTALVAKYNGENVCVRVGWEQNGANFAWSFNWIDPNTGLANGVSAVKTMFNRVVTRARAVGYTGYFEQNGGTTNGAGVNISSWSVTTTDSRILMGFDAYNSISNSFSYKKDNYQGVWDNEMKPQLDQITNYCRAHGLLAGISESGMIYRTDSSKGPFSSNDNSLYYSLMRAYLAANADVWAYWVLFNQNQYSGSTITENDQYFYAVNGTVNSPGAIGGSPDTVVGSGPTPTNAAMGSLTNTNNAGTAWADSTSVNKPFGLDAYKANAVAGNIQLPNPVAPPAQVVPSSTDSSYNFFAPFG